MKVSRYFYCKFYQTLHAKFLEKEFSLEEAKKFQYLSPKVWYKDGFKARQFRVAVRFQGGSDRCGRDYFYSRYRGFEKHEKLEDCQIDARTFFKALVYIGVGERVEFESSKGQNLKLIFDDIDKNNEWNKAHTQIRLEQLKELFKNKYYPPDAEEYTTLLPTASENSDISNALIFENNAAVAKDFEDKVVVEKFDSSGKRKPQILGHVPSRTDDFVGRGHELATLYQTISTSKKIVFLHGVPGIGKTSLVKCFIEQYGGNFDHVAWISIGMANDEIRKENISDGQSQIEAAFTPLYIFLNGGSIDPTLNIEQRFEYTIGLLNSIKGNNLLVVDNFDDRIISYRHKLPINSYWTILVTGRSEVPGLTNVLLSSLTKKDAIKLFETFCQKPVDADLLQKFLIEISYHTLMIEVAAKTLEETDAITLESLYEKLLKGQLNDPELDQIILTEHGADKGELIKQLLFLFDVVSLSQNEIIILKTWYYLEPNSYTLEEVSNFTDVNLGELKLLLSELSKKGWIIYSSKEKTYTLHRLIQKVIFYSLSPKATDVQILINFFSSELIDRGFDFTSLLQTQSRCNYLFSQLQGNELVDLDLLTLLFYKAVACQKLGMITDARANIEEGLKAFEKFTEYDKKLHCPLKRLLAMKLSDICINSKEYEAASIASLEALNNFYFSDEEDPAWNRDHIHIYRQLVLIYNHLGDKESAQLSYERLTLFSSSQETGDFQFFALENQLLVLVTTEDFENAKPIGDILFKEYTKKYCENEMGPSEYAEKNVLQGIIAEELGEFESAFKYFSSAVDLLEKLVVEQSTSYELELAKKLCHLGNVLIKMGNIQEALIKFEMIWQIYKKNLSLDPKFYLQLLNFSWALVELSSKPVSNDIIKMLQSSLIAMQIYSKDQDENAEFLNITAQILGWSQEEFKKFINEIISQAQKIIINSQ